MQDEISKELQDIVSKTWGDEGRQWLKKLPNIIEQCEKKWHVQRQKSPFGLSFNFVTPVVRDNGKEAVLKIGFPHSELFAEMDALRAFNGRHTAKLFESDKELGAMLLEKITPGKTLKEIQKNNDEEATRIAAQLIRDIPIATNSNTFPHMHDWAKAIQKAQKKECIVPSEMLQRALDFIGELNVSRKEEKLLHGDLHHTNILIDDKRGWIAIDPKGVIGDPAFNAARFLNNPRDITFTKEMLTKRLEILSQTLEKHKLRIAKWGYVDCIISACWTMEDEGDPKIDLSCAKILESLIDT